MSYNPLVSVIIPAFNAQDLIGETIESILSQTYNNLEVIVVDDGSIDGTAAVVKGFGKRVRYYYEENSGGCAVPRNTGILRSSGDFLCFLDADDLLTDDRIARQVEFMERHPEVGIVFCDYRNFNEAGPYVESHFQTCPRLSNQLENKREMVLDKSCELLVQENFGSAGSFLIRRETMKFVTGFEATLKACEDFHFYFRAARHVPVGLINEVGMLRRLHGANMSSNDFKMFTERIRSRTLLHDCEDDPAVCSYLKKYIGDCQGALARIYADKGFYTNALQQDWKAFMYNFSWKRFQGSCRSSVRTLLMAMGIHTPKANCR